jgi:CNT family concentrative nucleoside transporter
MKSAIRSLIWVLPILSLLFSSCGSEELSPESKLKGKWLLTESDAFQRNDSTEYFIVLDVTENGNSFISNCIIDKEIKGDWTYDSTGLKLTYQIPNWVAKADAFVIVNDSAGVAHIDLTNQGEPAGSMSNEGVVMHPEKDLAIIATDISSLENSLRISIPNKGVYEFQRDIIIDPGFSIVSILRGLLGIAFLLLIAYVFSSDRKSIDWNLVGKGIAMQVIIALLVLKAPYVDVAFMLVSEGFVTLIGYTNAGVDFLFGQLGVGEVQPSLITFAVKVLPTIIFFSALMSLLYYWGILQKIVYAFAWFMKKFMRLSGAESLAAAGNVFLGQTESPLLVKPYLLGMTKSELMCLMTGGMATIAGGVLAAYIGFLGGDDPVAQAFFAKHLLTASIISAPAAIVAAKMLLPETEKVNENLEISKDKIGVNALEAISNGTTDGLKLAVNVGAMLLVFIALMALANGMLGWFGDKTGLNDMIAANTNYDVLSFQFVLGYACSPIVWMMGVDFADTVYVGELLGQKTILNEFVAYPRLGEMKAQGLINEKSIIMSTYMLCGFANIASIGIQIGGIGALIPSRKGLLSQLGVKALIGGTIACLLTAVVVGMTL